VVNDTLAGNWSKVGGDDTSCVYRSARGGVFAITNVQEPDPERGIQDARAACDTTPREVTETKSFACIERGDTDDSISGNIVVRGEVFLFTMLGAKGGDHDPQLRAMTALLGAVDTR